MCILLVWGRGGLACLMGFFSFYFISPDFSVVLGNFVAVTSCPLEITS